MCVALLPNRVWNCVGAVWWVSRRLDVTKHLRRLDLEFALPDDIACGVANDLQLPDCLAGGAVLIAPVSKQIPWYQGILQGILRFWGLEARLSTKKPLRCSHFSSNSLRKLSAKIFRRTANFQTTPKQGQMVSQGLAASLTVTPLSPERCRH
jgi:hypothetical protein